MGALNGLLRLNIGSKVFGRQSFLSILGSIFTNNGKKPTKESESSKGLSKERCCLEMKIAGENL